MSGLQCLVIFQNGCTFHVTTSRVWKFHFLHIFTACKLRIVFNYKTLVKQNKTKKAEYATGTYGPFQRRFPTPGLDYLYLMWLLVWFGISLSSCYLFSVSLTHFSSFSVFFITWVFLWSHLISFVGILALTLCFVILVVTLWLPTFKWYYTSLYKRNFKEYSFIFLPSNL